MPAPPSRWPRLDFTAPRSRGKLREPKADRKAPVSMGSPNSVPVPWVSTCHL